jgi:hypothetical protein
MKIKEQLLSSFHDTIVYFGPLAYNKLVNKSPFNVFAHLKSLFGLKQLLIDNLARTSNWNHLLLKHKLPI